jgi:hypothetical protein
MKVYIANFDFVQDVSPLFRLGPIFGSYTDNKIPTTWN